MVSLGASARTSIGARTAISNPTVSPPYSVSPPLLSLSGHYKSSCRTRIAGNTQGARWSRPLSAPAGKIGTDSQPAAACKTPVIISGTAIDLYRPSAVTLTAPNGGRHICRRTSSRLAAARVTLVAFPLAEPAQPFDRRVLGRGRFQGPSAEKVCLRGACPRPSSGGTAARPSSATDTAPQYRPPSPWLAACRQSAAEIAGEFSFAARPRGWAAATQAARGY